MCGPTKYSVGRESYDEYEYSAQGGSGKERMGSHTAGYNDVLISKGPTEGTAKPEPIRSQSDVRGSLKEEAAHDVSSVGFVESTPSTLGGDGQCEERRGHAGLFLRVVNSTGPRTPERQGHDLRTSERSAYGTSVISP